jgi:hypothetical protein
VNLDHLTLVVRERTLGELCDLALLLVRRHARDLAVLLLLGALPCVVLDTLLLRLLGVDDWSALAWLVVLLLLQAPLVTAPITAYLGEAMFTATPSRAAAWVACRRVAGPLLLAAVARAGLIAVPVLLFGALGGLPGLLLLFLLMFFPAHLGEVLLLERQGLRGGWKRASQLMAAWRSEAVTHFVVAALLIVGGSLSLTLGASEIANLLVWNAFDREEWWAWFHPGESLLPVLLPWPFIGYLAVVRFLAYIDLRTRREGWEIELDLRRAGRRIVGDGAAT